MGNKKGGSDLAWGGGTDQESLETFPFRQWGALKGFKQEGEIETDIQSVIWRAWGGKSEREKGKRVSARKQWT